MMLENKCYYTYIYTAVIKDTLMVATVRTVATTVPAGNLHSVLSEGQVLC